MRQFGDELRAEREARGVGVEEICAATKVSTQHVLALEAGEVAQLPGGVFRRGIVRSYVGALGLDEAAWTERFERMCREAGLAGESDRDWVQFAENVKRNRTVERTGMGLRWVGVALLVIGLVAMAWLGWRLVRHRGGGLREMVGVREDATRAYPPISHVGGMVALCGAGGGPVR